MVPIDREVLEQMLKDAEDHKSATRAALNEALARVGYLEKAYSEVQRVEQGLRQAAVALRLPVTEKEPTP